MKSFKLIITVLCIAFIVNACDKGVTSVEKTDNILDTNYLVLTTSGVTQVNDKVFVDNQEVFTLQLRQDSSLLIQDESIYTYNTQFESNGNEIDFPWINHFVGATAKLNQSPKRTSINEHLVINHLDLGDLQINGLSLKAENADDVDFGDDIDKIDIINYRSYFYHIFNSHTEQIGTLQGNTFVDLITPLYAPYTNGSTMTISASNSTEIDDITVEIDIPVAPRLQEVKNGERVIDLESDMPVISASEELILNFDKELIKEEVFFVFKPVSSITSGSPNYSSFQKKVAFVRLLENNNQIVLSSEILQDLKSNSSVSNELYEIFILNNSAGLKIELTKSSNGEKISLPTGTQTIINMFVSFGQ